MRHDVIIRIALLVPMSLLVLAVPVQAQKAFNQGKAMQGNVTPGDAPGFPVTISKEGAYTLTSNLTVPDKHTTAIEITASNVTLDLNGFAILGPGELGVGYGIFANNSSNVTVVNGSVRGMGADAVALRGRLHRVEKVHAKDNGIGILVGHNSLVIGCTAGFNRRYGIYVEHSSVVRESTAVANEVGIAALSGSSVLGNTIRSNTWFGLLFFEPAGYAQNGTGRQQRRRRASVWRHSDGRQRLRREHLPVTRGSRL